MSSIIRRIRLGTLALTLAGPMAAPAVAQAQNQAVVLKPTSPT